MLMTLEMEKEENGGGGDLSHPFYYVAGPMSGYEEFNFPEFYRVAELLREAGHNIVNPAELDVEEHRKIVAERDGLDAPSGTLEWVACLRRDLAIVQNENCLGCICIDGWEGSKGAQLETYNAAALGLKLYKFEDSGPDQFTLVELDRTEDMKIAGTYE